MDQKRTLPKKEITLRPVTDADREFLYEVYASTRLEELAPVPWTEVEKTAFLRMQFDLQAKFYAENYSRASFQVILFDGAQAGRLYVERRSHEIRIMDISLLPAFRGQGIGTVLIAGILSEGQSQRLPVTIHVERMNPALMLYERLGFTQVADKGVYYLLQWNPVRDPKGAHEAG